MRDPNHSNSKKNSLLSGPLIEYQMIEKMGPKVIALHREKVNIFQIETRN